MDCESCYDLFHVGLNFKTLYTLGYSTGYSFSSIIYLYMPVNVSVAMRISLWLVLCTAGCTVRMFYQLWQVTRQKLVEN
jgi:hypothetical protein